MARGVGCARGHHQRNWKAAMTVSLGSCPLRWASRSPGLQRPHSPVAFLVWMLARSSRRSARIQDPGLESLLHFLQRRAVNLFKVALDRGHGFLGFSGLQRLDQRPMLADASSDGAGPL